MASYPERQRHDRADRPESPEFEASQLDGLPSDGIEKITHRDALRFYRIGEHATIKARRAKAAGLDLHAPRAEGMTGPPKGEKMAAARERTRVPE